MRGDFANLRAGNVDLGPTCRADAGARGGVGRLGLQLRVVHSKRNVAADLDDSVARAIIRKPPAARALVTTAIEDIQARELHGVFTCTAEGEDAA